MTSDLREPTVVVSVMASKVTYLEANAYEAAKSAFEAYGSGTDWKTAQREQLGLVRESDILRHQQTGAGMSGQTFWKATYRVGVTGRKGETTTEKVTVEMTPPEARRIAAILGGVAQEDGIAADVEQRIRESMQ